MAAFRFGVDSFIWTEVFSEKDIWILPKAKELGFDVVDLAIALFLKLSLGKGAGSKTADGTGIGDHHYIGAGYQSDFSG